MSLSTRETILKVGRELVFHQGFNNTGIQEVLNLAGVPKGSFYFYFDSKEDFGLELVDGFGDYIFKKAGRFLTDEKLTPLNRLKNYFTWFFNGFEKNKFNGGCPMGNLSLEMGDLNHKFQEKLGDFFGRLKTLLAECLDQAKVTHEIPDSIDSSEMADFIISAWEGALLQMKAKKDNTSRRVFEHIVFDRLLNNAIYIETTA